MEKDAVRGRGKKVRYGWRIVGVGLVGNGCECEREEASERRTAEESSGR